MTEQRLIDLNDDAGMALVERDGIHTYVDINLVRGVPLAPCPSAWLLKQMHYCARAKVTGLPVTVEAPIMDGWQRVEEYRQLYGAF